MKFAVLAAALATLGLGAPAHADMRVVAGNGLTLTEAAQIKFNRDTRSDDRHVAVTPGRASGDYARLAASFGMTAEEASGMSLAEIFVAKVNHGESRADQQMVKGSGVAMATRSPHRAASSQLAASAGLTPAEAAGMSLTEIAAAKFARGPAND